MKWQNWRLFRNYFAKAKQRITYQWNILLFISRPITLLFGDLATYINEVNTSLHRTIRRFIRKRMEKNQSSLLQWKYVENIWTKIKLWKCQNN
jgi:hypothetical protein